MPPHTGDHFDHPTLVVLVPGSEREQLSADIRTLGVVDRSDRFVRRMESEPDWDRRS